jgi:choline transport protein
MVTCSRMIQSFSKDGCLPFPRYLGASSPRWEVPVYAVLFNTAWLTIFGLLLFASPLAIVAIQSASVVMLQCSYLPVTFLFLFRGRKWVDEELRITRTFTMGKQWGPIINIIALAYISITTVFFLFPSVYPVTSASLMNYAVVVVVVSALLATVNWFVFVRNHFTAPLGLLTVHSTATTSTDSTIS